MEQEHTPAKSTQARTIFRFTRTEAAEALVEWLAKNGAKVPDGRVYAEPWTIVLVIVDHDDPPPTRKDVNDE